MHGFAKFRVIYQCYYNTSNHLSAQQMFRHNWTVCLFKLCLESVKQASANLCYCVALWLLCWLWTGFHWAGFLTQKNQLVGKYLPEFSVAILSRSLSSYYSMVSSLTLNMLLLGNPVKSKSRCSISMAIISWNIIF